MSGHLAAVEPGAMRALTLWRPWPWVILQAPEPARKAVENRPRKYPKALHGELFAIHAGKHYDGDSVGFILRVFNELTGDAPPDSFLADSQVEGIVGVARLAGIAIDRLKLPADQQPWFTGPYGWLLSDVRPLKTPIPIRGAQGFWRVPAPVQAAIEAELVQAEAGAA